MPDRVRSVTCAAVVACSRQPRSGAAGETWRCQDTTLGHFSYSELEVLEMGKHVVNQCSYQARARFATEVVALYP